MPDIEVGGKALVSQSGTADPVIQSNVNFTGAIDSTATGTFSGTTTGTHSGTTAGTISSSVTGQNRPYFFCSEYSSNQTGFTSDTELTAWTEGTNGDPDSKFDTSTGRFTPGVAGIYLFGARIFFESQGSSFTRIILRVNNGSNSDVYSENQAGHQATLQITRTEYLSDTGYASVLARSHSNSNTLRGSQCHFWGIRIA